MIRESQCATAKNTEIQIKNFTNILRRKIHNEMLRETFNVLPFIGEIGDFIRIITFILSPLINLSSFD